VWQQNFTPTTPSEAIFERIDVNQSSAKGLEFLPGIGPKLALAIVQHRRWHGLYKAPSDLLNVKGIGPKRLERIMPYLVFSSPGLPHNEKGRGGDAESSDNGLLLKREGQSH
jgi:competence ComEA-like helix-hairpin-helix protein